MHPCIAQFKGIAYFSHPQQNSHTTLMNLLDNFRRFRTGITLRQSFTCSTLAFSIIRLVQNPIENLLQPIIRQPNNPIKHCKCEDGVNASQQSPRQCDLRSKPAIRHISIRTPLEYGRCVNKLSPALKGREVVHFSRNEGVQRDTDRFNEEEENLHPTIEHTHCLAFQCTHTLEKTTIFK